MTARQQDDDATLVQRFRDGDLEAFDALVVRYETRARKLAFGFVRTIEAAEDVAQDSFLQAYRRIRSLKRPGSFRSWLFTIVVNRARDELRLRSRYDDVEDLEVPLRKARQPLESERVVESREMRRVLKGMVAELPARYREPLLLKEIEGMTYAEIAKLLGTPMGTIQIRIHRARLRLRDRLAFLGVEKGHE